MSKRVKKVWKPQLFRRELYSEILDRTFTVSVTARTLDLIDDAFGFDFYILKASAGQCRRPRGGWAVWVWPSVLPECAVPRVPGSMHGLP